MDMQSAIKELQETAIVMSGIQSRQAAVPKDHGEWLEQHEKAQQRHSEWLEQHEKTMQRVDLALAEVADKHNALIHNVDDRRQNS